jgi:hypothetical protein
LTTSASVRYFSGVTAPARPLLDTLRARLDAVVAPTRRATPPIPTGVALLDQALGGGLPRGRITEVVGPLGAGKTTLLHRAVARMLAVGGWVAWVDARRTLAPEPFATLGGRFVAIRPRDGARAAWAADTLLRSGLFALVVVDGAPVLSRTAGFRLAQLAREQDAALVLLGEGPQATRAAGTVRLRLARLAPATPRSLQRRRHGELHLAAPAHRPGFTITIERGVGSASHPLPATSTAASSPSPSDTTTALLRPIPVAAPIVATPRLGLHADIPDRRAAAGTTRHPWEPRPADPAIDHHADAATRTWGGLGASVGDVHGHGHGQDHGRTPARTKSQASAAATTAEATVSTAGTTPVSGFPTDTDLTSDRIAPYKRHNDVSMKSSTVHGGHVASLGRPLHELGAWERARYREWEHRERGRGHGPDERVTNRPDAWTGAVGHTGGPLRRGRRRAAEAAWGHRSRRDEARRRTGARIDVGLPQGWQRSWTDRITAR